MTGAELALIASGVGTVANIGAGYFGGKDVKKANKENRRRAAMSNLIRSFGVDHRPVQQDVELGKTTRLLQGIGKGANTIGTGLNLYNTMQGQALARESAKKADELRGFQIDQAKDAIAKSTGQRLADATDLSQLTFEADAGSKGVSRLLKQPELSSMSTFEPQKLPEVLPMDESAIQYQPEQQSLVDQLKTLASQAGIKEDSPQQDYYIAGIKDRIRENIATDRAHQVTMAQIGSKGMLSSDQQVDLVKELGINYGYTLFGTEIGSNKEWEEIYNKFDIIDPQLKRVFKGNVEKTQIERQAFFSDKIQPILDKSNEVGIKATFMNIVRLADDMTGGKNVFPKDEMFFRNITKEIDARSEVSGLSNTDLALTHRLMAVNDIAKNVIHQLENEGLLEHIKEKVDAYKGETEGFADRAYAWFAGDKTALGAEGVALLKDLKFMTDATARLNSGAALTEDEIVFYTTMIGGITTRPEDILVNLKSLVNNQETKIKNIFKAYDINRGITNLEGTDRIEGSYEDTLRNFGVLGYLSTSTEDIGAWGSQGQRGNRNFYANTPIPSTDPNQNPQVNNPYMTRGIY